MGSSESKSYVGRIPLWKYLLILEVSPNDPR
jgi:hypothetical protein